MSDMNEQKILIKAIMMDLMMMCEEYKENEPIATRLTHIKNNVIDLDKLANEADKSTDKALILSGVSVSLPSDDEIKLKDNGFGAMEAALNKLKGNEL